MRVLIVGGTSSLAKALKPVFSEFSDVLTSGRSGCDIQMDLCESVENIEIPKDIDVVINTAAHFGGDEYDQIYQAEFINVLGVLKLCQACVRSKVKHLIHISSTSACLEPESKYFGIYSISKKHSDEIVQMFCAQFNLPYTIIRPSQLYGNDNGFRKHRRFLYEAIDKAKRNEDIGIFGVNDALRNYIHIDDFTEIISRIVTAKIVGIYLCTNQIDVSLSEVANTVIEAFHSESRVIFISGVEDVENNVFPYDDTLFKKINYHPQIPIMVGISKIAICHSQNYS